MKNRHSLALLMLAGSLALAPVANADYVVRMETVRGNIDLMLLEHTAPGTVNNFISNYVDKGAYNNTIIHRVATQANAGLSAIQGGGFAWDDGAQQLALIPEAARIDGEYYLPGAVSNVRSTIAMALHGSPADPNSATDQWFINASDNSAALDSQGFTAFGYVLGDGMTIVDDIAGLPLVDTSTLPLNDTLVLQPPLLALAPNVPITTLLNSVFGAFPLIDYTSGPIGKSNLVLISNIRVMARGPLGTIGWETGVLGDKHAILSLSKTDAYSGVGVNFTSVATNPDPDHAPTGVTFDQGFYRIILSNVSPAHIAVVLGVPEDQPLKQASRVYKYGPTPDNHDPHWYDFMYDKSTGTGAVINGSMIMLLFADGQRGDDDLTVNGTIGDATSNVIAVSSTPATSSGGGGGTVDLCSLLAGLFAISWKMGAIGSRRWHRIRRPR